VECPKCQSENVQAMPVAYHAGVSNIDTTSKSGPRLGVGLAGGGLGVGVLGGGRTKTKGISVSSLSEQLAPPVQMTSGLKKIGCLSLLGVCLVTFVAAASQNGIATTIVFLAALIGAGYWIYYSIDKAHKYNQNVFPGLMDTWNQSWFCLRCGNVFEVSR
jgi:hypothetical protein